MAGTTKRECMGKKALILSVANAGAFDNCCQCTVGIGVPACCFQPLRSMEVEYVVDRYGFLRPYGRKEDFQVYQVDLSSFCRTVRSKTFTSSHASLNRPNRVKVDLEEAIQSDRTVLQAHDSTMREGLSSDTRHSVKRDLRCSQQGCRMESHRCPYSSAGMTFSCHGRKDSI